MADLTTLTQSQGGGPMGFLGGLLGGAQMMPQSSPGLLGNGWNDPKSMANMALAAGMIRGDFGGGLLGAGQAMQNGQDLALKRQMLMADIALKQIAEQRAQQQWKMQQDAFYGLDSGGSAPGAAPSSQPAIPASGGGSLGSGTFGVQTGGQLPAAPQSATSQNNYDAQLKQLGRWAIAGVPGAKENLDILKLRMTPQQIAAGSYSLNPVTGAQTYNPDPTKGVTIGPNGEVQLMPGAAAVQSQLADIPEVAKAKLDPLPLSFVTPGPNGRPIGGSRFDYLNPQSAPQVGQPQVRNQGGGSLTPELQAAILADAQKNGGPAPTVNLNAPGLRNPVFGLQQQLPPSVVRVQPDAAQGVGGAAGGLQSAAEAEAAKAQALADVERANKPGITSATDIASGAAKNFTDYQGQLNKDVNSGYQQYLRNQQIRQLLKEYQTGLAAPDARSAFASNLQNLFPESDAARAFAEKVNGGNVGSGQELAQILSAAGLTNVIKTLDGNGRVNKAEYQALQEHAEKNTTDPSAMLGIMGFQDNLYKQQLAEQQALASQVKAGTLNPQTWEADYAQLRHDKQTPSTLPPTPGQTAAAKTAPPVPIKGMVRNGYVFKGGDPGVQSNWEKQ